MNVRQLTVKQLRAICTTCGINYYNKTKSSLLNELKRYFETYSNQELKIVTH